MATDLHGVESCLVDGVDCESEEIVGCDGSKVRSYSFDLSLLDPTSNHGSPVYVLFLEMFEMLP